ncbi:MAG: TAXI family TRAP transporter solute-binding subunit [Micromonosporaceae bacterium]|nr:TAXI family TRAP transporter solute-binding subunit [Micromonosporaceae bacterium]
MRVRAAARAVLVLLLVTGAGNACTTRDAAAPQRLVIAAGPADSVYRLLGDALGAAARRAWSAEVEVVGHYGSVDNLRLVAEGEADVGFATVDTAELAVQGNTPFDRAVPIRALARLYDEYLQAVALSGSGIEELADLAGRQVSIGEPRSGTDVAANRVLQAAEVEPGQRVGNLSAETAAQALVQREEVDAIFVAGGLPTPVVAAVVAAPPAAPPRLLPMADLVPELQRRFGESYQARSIPPGTYPGVDATVETVGIVNVLVVRQDLPEDLARRVTELLFSAKAQLVAAHPEARRLDHRSAVATFPIELHPGATRYYQAAKPLAAAGAGRPGRDPPHLASR